MFLFKSVIYLINTDHVFYFQSKLTLWSDEDKVDLILTTGGTGFAPRDVTPEVC